MTDISDEAIYPEQVSRIEKDAPTLLHDPFFLSGWGNDPIDRLKGSVLVNRLFNFLPYGLFILGMNKALGKDSRLSHQITFLQTGQVETSVETAGADELQAEVVVVPAPIRTDRACRESCGPVCGEGPGRFQVLPKYPYQDFGSETGVMGGTSAGLGASTSSSSNGSACLCFTRAMRRRKKRSVSK